MLKHQFLILNQEILSNGYRNTQTLPKEQERILNYRNGIRAQIIRESRSNEMQFFKALQGLYGNTKIPLLTAETSLILFKKYVRNKDTFRCFEFLSKQLDKHPCVQQAEFWALVIQEFYMTTNGTFENQKYKLTLYVDIVKALYKKSNIESYRYLVKYVLNQSDEAIQIGRAHV